MAGARTVQFMVDHRTHGVQSLLQRNLAPMQGPALLVGIPDVVLSTEEICRLQAFDKSVPLHGRHFTSGCGLIGGYRLSSMPSIISGPWLYLFDPLGDCLGDNEAQSFGKPVGKAYAYLTSSLPRRFPDQFAPFRLWGFDPSTGYKGTIVRYPLRYRAQDHPDDLPAKVDLEGAEPADDDLKKPEAGDANEGKDGGTVKPNSTAVAESWATQSPMMPRDQAMPSWRVKDLEPLVEAFKSRSAESLLFRNNLENVTCAVWPQGAPQPHPLFTASVSMSPGLREKRCELRDNNQWDKFSLTNMFSRFKPPSSIFHMEEMPNPNLNLCLHQ